MSAFISLSWNWNNAHQISTKILSLKALLLTAFQLQGTKCSKRENLMPPNGHLNIQLSWLSLALGLDQNFRVRTLEYALLLQMQKDKRSD